LSSSVGPRPPVIITISESGIADRRFFFISSALSPVGPEKAAAYKRTVPVNSSTLEQLLTCGNYGYGFNHVLH
jgi:hypothetical protein